MELPFIKNLGTVHNFATSIGLPPEWCTPVEIYPKQFSLVYQVAPSETLPEPRVVKIVHRLSYTPGSFEGACKLSELYGVSQPFRQRTPNFEVINMPWLGTDTQKLEWDQTLKSKTTHLASCLISDTSILLKNFNLCHTDLWSNSLKSPRNLTYNKELNRFCIIDSEAIEPSDDFQAFEIFEKSINKILNWITLQGNK